MKQTKGNYPYNYLNKQNMFNNNNQEREDHQLSSVPLTHHH